MNSGPGNRRPGASGTSGSTRRTAGPRRPGEGRPGGARPEQGAAPRPSISAVSSSWRDHPAARRWRKTKTSTRRLAILGGVVMVLAIMVVPTLRAYLEQREQIQGMQEQVARQEQIVADLTAEQQNWNNKEYVVRQARRRLKMVMPGESVYEVVGVDGVAAGAPGEGHSATVNPRSDAMPWYGKVWDSLAQTDTVGRDPDIAQTTPVDPAKTAPGGTAGPAGASAGSSSGSSSSGSPAAGSAGSSRTP